MAVKQKKRTDRVAPVDRIERWPIGKLVPYARNPRLHSPQQVDQIAASMTEYGQAQLIVVDEQGEIIAGHGRVLAAEQLRWKDVAVGIAVGWTEPQRRAYRIVDNKLALSSSWDDALLKMELEGLKTEDYDLGLLGFADSELSVIFDGWSSDIDVRERFGSNTDGIWTKLGIEVEQKNADSAREAVIKALNKVGVAYRET